MALAAEAKRLIDADVPKRVGERSKQQSSVATYSGWLAGLEGDISGVFSSTDLDMAVNACPQAAVSKRSAAEASLATAKSEYANFSKLKEQSLNLAQELRQIASRILKNNTKPDECPLCHTRFAPGELTTHMNVGVDEHLEGLGQKLLAQVQEQEAALRVATADEAGSAWLKKFCERASLAAGISVRSALNRVEDSKRALAEAQERLKTLHSEVLTLEAQGLSVTRLEDISRRLSELGYPLVEFSPEAVAGLLKTITQSSANSSLTLDSEKIEADALQQTLEATLGSAESDVQILLGALSRMKERLATTESVRAKLGRLPLSFLGPGKSR